MAMVTKTILLVEDNPDDEALTLRALKKHNFAHTVDVVRDGAEALDYIFGKGDYADRDKSTMPQLILLDIKLPKVDGLEVLKEIRSNEKYHHIPIVMLTTSTEESDVVRSYKNGANSFIKKPVDFSEFLDVVNKLGIYWLAINTTPQK